MDIPSYLMGAIKGAHDAGIKYVVVQELPTTGEEGIIYLVPKSTSKTNNIYDEYMYISNNWELIGDTEADLSDYQKLIQYSIIPTASATNEGKIIQYTGTTTNDYTNGYFYICVEDNNTYSWENLNVQDAGGLPSDLAKIYLCTSTTGGSSGELFDVCKKIWNDYKNGIKSAMYLQPAHDYMYTEQDKVGLYYFFVDTTWNTKSLRRMWYTNTINNTSSYTSNSGSCGNISFTITNDELSSVSFSTSQNNNSYTYLTTNYDYPTPYTPQYAGSPATKKYVDDSIASAIGTALQGNY